MTLVQRPIKGETLVMLGVLFAIYVVGDLTTTIWLIANYPGGIEEEWNPFASSIYNQWGISGMILSKVMYFIFLSTTVLILESLFSHEKKVTLATNFAILGLIALSLIVLTTNVLLIFQLSLNDGSYETKFLTQVYAIFLGLILAILIIMPKFLPKSLGKVEISLMVAVLLGPVLFSPGLYKHLAGDELYVILSYLGISVGTVGLLIFGMNRLYNRIIPKFNNK